MAIRSVSFDDDDDPKELYVFSGHDLLISHLDVADLDWKEVAERSSLDERRGLVITQVAVLEDLIDEFIKYLVDPPDPGDYQSWLDGKTLGPRLDLLQKTLRKLALLDDTATGLLAELRAVVNRRNDLAHGTLDVFPLQHILIKDIGKRDVDLEWRISNRKTRSWKRISMSELRHDLYQAIGCFTGMLQWGVELVQRAPRPAHFRDGLYLAVPTP